MPLRSTVFVATPAPGKVELFVGTRTGAELLTPPAARAVAAELLVAADRADEVEASPSPGVALEAAD